MKHVINDAAQMLTLTNKNPKTVVMLSRLCVVSRWDSAAGRQITFSFLFLFPLGKYTKYINVREEISSELLQYAVPVYVYMYS